MSETLQCFYLSYEIQVFLSHIKYKLNQKTQKLLKLLSHQNDFLCPLSLLHRFLAFFPPKTGGRLNIILPSFPAGVARGELYLWFVLL